MTGDWWLVTGQILLASSFMWNIWIKGYYSTVHYFLHGSVIACDGGKGGIKGYGDFPSVITLYNLFNLLLGGSIYLLVETVMVE